MSALATGADLAADSTALKATIQRQADQIESLHAAAQKYKSRNTALEQQLTVKQAELDSLRLLTTENSALREEMFTTNERNRELEQAVSRLTEASTLGAESQAQLGVKVQAYQRHNAFLQGELASAETKLATARERIDVLQNELRHKEQRLTLLIEKLRQHNIDPTTAGGNNNAADSEAYRELREKYAAQETTVTILREKAGSMQEEAVRREEVIAALRRENNALKSTVSRLIALTSGASVEVPSADGAASPSPTAGAAGGDASPSGATIVSTSDALADRLAAFKRNKLGTSSMAAGRSPSAGGASSGGRQGSAEPL